MNQRAILATVRRSVVSAKAKVGTHRLYWLLPAALFQGVIFGGVVLGIMVTMNVAKLPF
jgi:hypothetical protein